MYISVEAQHSRDTIENENNSVIPSEEDRPGKPGRSSQSRDLLLAGAAGGS